MISKSALEKAGKHMEDSVVASYVALLIGCIVQDNEVINRRTVLWHHMWHC